jgi:cytochrome c biogenesis protein CcmG, thiol:disulfide interchange protein DsbE
MLKSRLEWTAVFLVAALTGIAWILISRTPLLSTGPITLAEAPIVGQLAPDFSLNTPQGELVLLSDIVDRDGNTGMPVVLNFWASWCGPCRVEMPDLQRTSMKFNGRSTILGINQGESAKVVTTFGAEFNISYPLLVDEDNDVNREYMVSSLPTTIFIDAKGIVREVHIGILTQAVLEDRIEQILAESGQ